MCLLQAGYQRVLMVDFDGYLPEFYHPQLSPEMPTWLYALALVIETGAALRCVTRRSAPSAETARRKACYFTTLFAGQPGLYPARRARAVAMESHMSPSAGTSELVWRGAMTGVCFALFGLGGLLLSLIWFNLLLIVIRNKPRRRRLARRAALPPASASFGGGQSRRRAGLPH